MKIYEICAELPDTVTLTAENIEEARKIAKEYYYKLIENQLFVTEQPICMLDGVCPFTNTNCGECGNHELDIPVGLIDKEVIDHIKIFFKIK